MSIKEQWMAGFYSIVLQIIWFIILLNPLLRAGTICRYRRPAICLRTRMIWWQRRILRS